ncbi:unnamed protein product [Leptidea sinapis]|uniref:Uncharacterized protein n=1 Tax=Leptidea sinapis TaxID=189913 RepID=A0A5E4PLS7_9NEOP|nr:unnamed protein product [Leptidea sinapis]
MMEERSKGNFAIIKFDKLIVKDTLANKKEIVHGSCKPRDGTYLYRDVGKIEAPGQTATGTYALSLYDLHFHNITCIAVTVGCKSRTVTHMWIDKGFHQEDLGQFVKIIPDLPDRGSTIPPKILYIKDKYQNYENISTTNILFKFIFTNKATIRVDFYGHKNEPPQPTWPPFPDDI